MFRRGGGCWILGVCAVALGAGILIAAIFPVGGLMFLVAVLLIACGCAVHRRTNGRKGRANHGTGIEKGLLRRL